MPGRGPPYRRPARSIAGRSLAIHISHRSVRPWYVHIVRGPRQRSVASRGPRVRSARRTASGRL